MTRRREKHRTAGVRAAGSQPGAFFVVGEERDRVERETSDRAIDGIALSAREAQGFGIESGAWPPASCDVVDHRNIRRGRSLSEDCRGRYARNRLAELQRAAIRRGRRLEPFRRERGLAQPGAQVCGSRKPLRADRPAVADRTGEAERQASVVEGKRRLGFSLRGHVLGSVTEITVFG